MSKAHLARIEQVIVGFEAGYIIFGEMLLEIYFVIAQASLAEHRRGK